MAVNSMYLGKIKDVNINLIAPYTSKDGKIFFEL